MSLSSDLGAQISMLSDPWSSDFHARLMSKYGLPSENINGKSSHWEGLVLKTVVSETKAFEFFKIQPAQ